MSQPSQHTQPLQQEIVQVIKKQSNIKSLISDIITFISIISAYQLISLSFSHTQLIQKLLQIRISSPYMQTYLLLIFGIYLITLKVLSFVAYKYDTKLPNKKIVENWEQEGQQSKEPIITKQQLEARAQDKNSYSKLIQELQQKSVYYFVFMATTTAYTFVQLRQNGLTDHSSFDQIQQINYLILWFITAILFYSTGRIAGKITGITTLHHLGLTMAIVVLILQLGLIYGVNMFVFV